MSRPCSASSPCCPPGQVSAVPLLIAARRDAAAVALQWPRPVRATRADPLSARATKARISYPEAHQIRDLKVATHRAAAQFPPPQRGQRVRRRVAEKSIRGLRGRRESGGREVAASAAGCLPCCTKNINFPENSFVKFFKFFRGNKKNEQINQTMESSQKKKNPKDFLLLPKTL